MEKNLSVFKINVTDGQSITARQFIKETFSKNTQGCMTISLTAILATSAGSGNRSPSEELFIVKTSCYGWTKNGTGCHFNS